MPHKTCPQCNTKHGVRRKVCDCGHDFGIKSPKDTPLTPEPGLWVADTLKGMPRISPPAELDGSMLTIAEVSEHVAYEGLGYCIYAYIRPSTIMDHKLQDMWRRAQAEMRKINSYLTGHAHG